jgi:hypothetical protein
VAVLVAVLGLVGLIAGFRAYADQRYAASPHRPALEALRQHVAPGVPVVTDDLLVYEHLYPYLRGQNPLSLVETHDYLPPWQPRLEAVAAGSSGELWLYALPGSPLADWLSAHYQPLSSYQFYGWLLSGWDTQ